MNLPAVFSGAKPVCEMYNNFLSLLESAVVGSRTCQKRPGTRKLAHFPSLGSRRPDSLMPGLAAAASALLNRATPYIAAAGHSPGSAKGQTPVPPTPLHRTSVSTRARSGTLSFRRRVFTQNPHHRRGFPVPQAAPPESIMSTVLPNTPSQKSKARIMSISRALGAEKPAAKRPRS